MLNNKGNTTYRGDTGLFRAALLLSGFFRRSECHIFNDKSQEGWRRLKLWFADGIEEASQEQQWALEGLLREVFGDRILSMYFIECVPWDGSGSSLCIRLKD